MKIEKLKIAELNPAEYNPRKMTNKQYEDLKNSLEKFGLVDPIIINADNTVVGGHQRLRIMRELGAEYVPTVRVNLSKEDEKELNIRLNKNTGEFDIDVLANNFEVDELKDWGFKDVELGFNIDKIDEPNFDELTDDLKVKPPTIKITFESVNDLKKAELEIKELIKLYNKSFYSVSCGEI
jgi:ParB-like chromosome segregation protein Spo0J